MKDVKLTLRDVYRASDVTRWQIVKCHKHQSLAEHSYQVAMIAWRLCNYLGDDEETARDCMMYALVHDVAEVVTGDIATPLKKFLSASDRLEEFERHVSFEGTNKLRFSDRVLWIVKLADLFEAYVFLENNAASQHGWMVQESLQKRITNMAGEAIWLFAEEMTHASLTTLDEVVEQC